MSDDKPNRTKIPTSTSLSTVVGIGEKAVLGMLPGGSVLADLLKAHRDELGAAMRSEAERRLDSLYAQMLEADALMDEKSARALMDDSDFHALLRACVADIEEEKVNAYATLARNIASGKVAQKYRRHFILSLRDFSERELTLLRYAYVAAHNKLIPPHGSGNVGEEEYLSAHKPGTFQTIHVSNLTAKGYVHEGKLSELGTEFAQAVWRPEHLEPGALSLRTWSGQHVAIVSYEFDSAHVESLAAMASDMLRRDGSKSSIVAITRDHTNILGMQASQAILLVGDQTAATLRHMDALKSFVAKVPTVAIAISATAIFPQALALKSCIAWDEKNLAGSLQEACRRLFELQPARDL